MFISRWLRRVFCLCWFARVFTCLGVDRVGMPRPGRPSCCSDPPELWQTAACTNGCTVGKTSAGRGARRQPTYSDRLHLACTAVMAAASTLDSAEIALAVNAWLDELPRRYPQQLADVGAGDDMEDDGMTLPTSRARTFRTCSTVRVESRINIDKAENIFQ